MNIFLTRLTIFSALLLLASWHSFAANEAFKFGKIPDDVVTTKTYAPDPEANAAVLSHVGNVKIDYHVSDGFLVNYSVHKVTKILNKDGLSHGDLEIPYYVIAGRKDDVFGIKGFVYNEVNGKIVKEKIEKEHIFDEEVNKNYRIKKISPPNVKEGSVIEISYEITSDLFSYIREWEFQADIPTQWSELTFEYPEYYSFTQATQGYQKFEIYEEKGGTGNAAWTNQERVTNGYTVSSQVSSNSVTYNTTKYHYAVKNAPALEPEPFIDNPSSYCTKVEFQLQSLQFPNSGRQILTGSWEKLAEELLEAEDFGKMLQKGAFAKTTVESLIADAASDEEKAVRIYNHITKKMTWDDRVGLYPTKALDKSYKEGKGSAADINMLLTLFLNQAGLSAFPVMTSTRGSGFLNPANPVRYRINYLLTLLVVGEKQILLDATNPSLHFGYLPLHAINFRGFAMIPGQSQWINVGNSAVNSEVMMVNMKIVDEELHASVSRNFQGYGAARIKGKIAVDGKEKYTESFSNELKDWDLKSIEWENLDTKDKAVVEKYELVGTSGFEVSGDRIYFNPFEEVYLSENPFKLDGRIFPIDFMYNQKRQMVVNIEVPAGYVVEEMPKGLINQFNEKGLVYSYRISSPSPDKIQIMISYQVNQTLFEASQYAQIKEFFDAIAQKQKENIVLKKV